MLNRFPPALSSSSFNRSRVFFHVFFALSYIFLNTGVYTACRANINRLVILNGV